MIVQLKIQDMDNVVWFSQMITIESFKDVLKHNPENLLEMIEAIESQVACSVSAKEIKHKSKDTFI